MSGAFAVRYTDAARDDLIRLFDFLLTRAQAVIETLTREIEDSLSRSPFIFRKAGQQSPFLRELIVPCRRSGYVALYEIENDVTVTRSWRCGISSKRTITDRTDAKRPQLR
jgi:plasmid stabilization system protein ParE